jgi:hypothetical protein
LPFVFTQGGKFVLQIPANLWTILIQNKRFEGIRPTPNPKPNSDGSYTVKLTTIQWKVFQENQKKPQHPYPAQPDQHTDEISVVKDRSMSKSSCIALLAPTEPAKFYVVPLSLLLVTPVALLWFLVSLPFIAWKSSI